jgi:hypothetical protein
MTCELGEMVEFQTPRARRQHTCCECHGPIVIGMRYQLVTGRWDGQFESWRTCLRCADLRDRYIQAFNLRHEELLAFGELMEALQESSAWV